MTSAVALIALDLDGTLIDLGGAGSRAMFAAFRALLDHRGELPTFSFAGRTDRAFAVETIAALRSAPATEAELAQLYQLYLDRLPAELERRPYRPTPGAAALVAELRRDESVRVGLVTGNVEAAARLKLASAGLDDQVDFGAFGDETADRARLLEFGFGRAEATLNPGQRALRWVVGDTPRDVAAAKAVGASAVALATGPYDLEALRASLPELTLADAAAALRAQFWRGPLEPTEIGS